MAYKKKTWEFRRAIEVMEYHTARYGAPGQKREKKKKPTKEDMEKVNQYTKERKAKHTDCGPISTKMITFPVLPTEWMPGRQTCRPQRGIGAKH